jgi:hypothetical protein
VNAAPCTMHCHLTCTRTLARTHAHTNTLAQQVRQFNCPEAHSHSHSPPHPIPQHSFTLTLCSVAGGRARSRGGRGSAYGARAGPGQRTRRRRLRGGCAALVCAQAPGATAAGETATTRSVWVVSCAHTLLLALCAQCGCTRVLLATLSVCVLAPASRVHTQGGRGPALERHAQLMR